MTQEKKACFDEETLKYLRLLSMSYKNINEASGEIINLLAVMNMPKGTEHFLSDVHGEYEAFSHVLRNASGVIKNYIDELFGDNLMAWEKWELATLVYYPQKMLDEVRKTEQDMSDWYKIHLLRLIRICKRVSSKYTRSKVRKALPVEFAYIMEELIHEDADRIHKNAYYNEIIHTIIRLERAGHFIVAISQLIQRLAVDHLHMIGDIFDRGRDADRIMDLLCHYHSLDFQWGNHDISWMGAASGSDALICNVIRISARYQNLHTIEEGYGINLVPLATFAMEAYRDDDCARFLPETLSEGCQDQKELALIAKMHKAITIMQFKVEAQLIARRPEYHMEDRVMLSRIHYEKKTVRIGGQDYALSDAAFPTIDPADPLALTGEEQSVLEKIRFSFMNSPKLREHVRLLFNQGSMYTVFNDNLLFHGCIPLRADGGYKETCFCGEALSGKDLLDRVETIVRQGHFGREGSEQRQKGLDLMWYLWCGSDSPLFGKDRMTTFERYFTDAKELYEEGRDDYYKLRNDEGICRAILSSFGINPDKGRIINGHVPVKVAKGESPVKANGRLIVIDGGFAKAYQAVTGIAGYTLISNSQGLLLASHEPFVSIDSAVRREGDVLGGTEYIEKYPVRKKVGDTDVGTKLKASIKDLECLLYAYRNGLLKEIE